ncbi:tetratricopeptide repeat protein [Shewanella dokdonensis]|uniref:Uncharacterized protein n=1 Tax=Shewanella dokdonensis TaxID=712036 RepID=A0ABX8DGT9_9GAMM|nr:hypothetical protein [Shewanella dokdonensis]MCL1074265.1 hypothetical protein [Shewanella dokdonensis]QVK23969.1 hypothetical protein KHX94_04845 [Shewanella dokdonensis]
MSVVLQRLTVMISLLAGIGACTAVPEQSVDAPSLWQDQYFLPVSDIPEPTSIFALPPAVVRDVRFDFQHQSVAQRLSAQQWLAKYLSAAEGGFRYQDNDTRIAADTFYQRHGNCMSLVILTAALAKILDVHVIFQSVKVAPVWDQQGNFNLLNGHINVRLKAASDSNVYQASAADLLVDFVPTETLRAYQTDKIDESMVQAMFFNNLAAEAMVNNQWHRAYAMLKVSLSLQPQFIAALNNLAILYRNNHQLPMTERVYRYALQLQPQNLTTLYNFAVLLDMQGRWDEWIAVHRILELERIRNPYYYYGMAQQAYREQRFTDAIRWYQLAIEKADYRHEFYFGLSRSYWALGERKQALNSLKKALQLSRDDNWTLRYQAKLNALRQH